MARYFWHRPDNIRACGSQRRNLYPPDIFTFFLEYRSVSEWQSADDRNNREKITRARQAAEDLFKPTNPTPTVDLSNSPPNNGGSTEQPQRRQPRIFTMPSRTQADPKPEVPAAPERTARKQASKPRTGAVPPSHRGRVRALTSYGMTPAQVAELYGVTVGEIERIINTPAYPAKAR